MLLEFRVECRQQVVDQALAEQDHLDVQRDGAWFQRRRRHQADDVRKVLDHDLLADQHPLQRRQA